MIVPAKLNQETAKILAKIDKACFKKDAWTKKEWLSYFSANLEVFFMYEDEKLIGASVWELNNSLSTAYLVSIEIYPKFQKMGHGAKLLNHRIEEFNLIGKTVLFAHSRKKNGASHKLLESAGFFINSYVPDYYFDEDGIEWKWVPGDYVDHRDYYSCFDNN
jgi:ribosomal protein S18 acetylase RimI-like enzyme